MRFLRYKCPKSTDDFGCRYPGWDDSPCENCGKTYEETQTVFDQVREFYYKVVPYDYRPKNIWYRLKCYLWKRYTTIKPRNLNHTYCDKVDLIPNLVFEAATQFLEKEGPQTQEQWAWEKEHNPDWYLALFEIRQICSWWLNEYNIDLEIDFSIPFKERMEKVHEDDKKLLEYAKRLIELSPYMWT